MDDRDDSWSPARAASAAGPRSRDARAWVRPLEVGDRVAVLEGRHFEQFSAGDAGVVVRVDEEASTCEVRFDLRDAPITVALRHLRPERPVPRAAPAPPPEPDLAPPRRAAAVLEPAARARWSPRTQAAAPEPVARARWSPRSPRAAPARPGMAAEAQGDAAWGGDPESPALASLSRRFSPERGGGRPGAAESAGAPGPSGGDPWAWLHGRGDAAGPPREGELWRRFDEATRLATAALAPGSPDEDPMDAALEEAVRASARATASASTSAAAEVRAATRELRERLEAVVSQVDEGHQRLREQLSGAGDDHQRLTRQVDEGLQRLWEQLSGAGDDHQRLTRQHGELSRQHGEVAAQLPELRQAVQGAVASAEAASKALSQVFGPEALSLAECGQRIQDLSRRVRELTQAEQQRQADKDAALGLGERLEELDRRVRLLARDDASALAQQREAQIEELGEFCRQRTAAVESRLDQVYKEFRQHFGGLEQTVARGARCEKALEELGVRAKQEASRSEQGVAELGAQVRHLQQEAASSLRACARWEQGVEELRGRVTQLLSSHEGTARSAQEARSEAQALRSRLEAWQESGRAEVQALEARVQAVQAESSQLQSGMRRIVQDRAQQSEELSETKRLVSRMVEDIGRITAMSDRDSSYFATPGRSRDLGQQPQPGQLRRQHPDLSCSGASTTGVVLAEPVSEPVAMGAPRAQGGGGPRGGGQQHLYTHER